jgi:hypothetical protein
VTPDNLESDHCGPDHLPHPGDVRRGTPTRVRVLTRGWTAVLAALLNGGAYLVGSSQDRTARRVGLGESAGQARAIAFGPGDQLVVATMLDGAIRVWRIGPGGSLRAGPPVVRCGVLNRRPDAGNRRRLGRHTHGGCPGPPTAHAADRRRADLRPLLQPRRPVVGGGGRAGRHARGPGDGRRAGGGEDRAARGGQPGARARRADPGDGWPGRVGPVLGPRDGSAAARRAAARPLRDRAGALRRRPGAGLGLRLRAGRPPLGRGHGSRARGAAGPHRADPGGGVRPRRDDGRHGGGADETVRLWDVPSGWEWACLRCPGVRPGALAFSPDGRALAAGGGSSRRSGSGTSPVSRGRNP